MKLRPAFATLLLLSLFVAGSYGSIWPSSTDWIPLLQDAGQLGDSSTDGQVNAREFVGDANNAAVYWYVDAVNEIFYARLRLDVPPVHRTGPTWSLRNFNWGVLFETNENNRKYEFAFWVNGKNPNYNVLFSENTTPKFLFDLGDKTEVDLASSPICLETINPVPFVDTSAPCTGDNENVLISVANTNFNGNPDYFMDFQLPLDEIIGHLSCTLQATAGVGSNGKTFIFDTAGCTCDRSEECYVSCLSNPFIIPELPCTESQTPGPPTHSRRPGATESATIGPIATVVGDPHFIGFGGQRFKIDAPVNTVYNLISTPTLQLNALFIKSPGPVENMVVMGEFGLQVRDDALFVSRKARLRLNDMPVEDEMTVFGDGHASVMRDVHHIVGGPIVRTRDMKFTIIPRGYEVDLKEVLLLVDGDASIHGLIGQTWNTTLWPESAKATELSAAEAWKYLEGSIEEYQVTDGLFGTNFLHNRFEPHFARHATPKVSELFVTPEEKVYPGKK